jgi:mRNA interferase RelE/StbE
LTYRITFHNKALSEWNSLDKGVRIRLAKTLEKRQANPHVRSAALLADLSGCYVVRVSKTGHRVVYRVDEFEKVLKIVSVGKRADKAVYRAAILRILDSE